eukprot:36071-Chlamydomonas_euryale.AAC.2
MLQILHPGCITTGVVAKSGTQPQTALRVPVICSSLHCHMLTPELHAPHTCVTCTSHLCCMYLTPMLHAHPPVWHPPHTCAA